MPENSHRPFETFVSGIFRIPGAAGLVSYAVDGVVGGRVLIDPHAGVHPAVLPSGPAVVRILLTHAQREHMEGADAFPGVPVFVARDDAWLCRTDQNYPVELWQEPWDWEHRGNGHGHLAGARNERPHPLPVSQIHPFDLEEGVEGFRVLRTPGHGKVAVTYLLEHPSGLLAFCGDLAHAGATLWSWHECEWDYGNESGQRALRESILTLMEARPDRLLPAHGAPIWSPMDELGILHERIGEVLCNLGAFDGPSSNVPDTDSPAPGFRQLAPQLHQWRNGNTLLLVSHDGHAIVIDDGLCLWVPWAERVARHDRIFDEAFAALGIRQVDWIIPTHFHGDHVDLMSHLAHRTGGAIATLPGIADVLERPEHFNLACMLPWYGTPEPRVRVDHRLPHGAKISWSNFELEFFLLGGQTRHHLGISTTIDDRGTLFVGDAWYGTSTEPPPLLCWNDAPPRSGGWVHALDQMIVRKPDLLVAGHGCSISHPLPLLLETRDNWNRRLAGFDRLNPHDSEEFFFSPFVQHKNKQEH